MAWTVTFTCNTDKPRVGQLVATWTEPTNEVFTYIDEQVNTNNTTAKNVFVNAAKAKQALWLSALNTTKSNKSIVETEFLTLLNG